MLRVVGCYCLLAVVGAGSARANVLVSWNSGAGSNGHHYELFETHTNSWLTAHNTAIGSSFMGYTGHLATITSQAEQDFIFNAFNNGVLHAAWIGLTDSESFGGTESSVFTNSGAPFWVWVTGEPVVYTAWVSSNLGSIPAPNNQLHIPEGEDFTELVFTNTDGTPGRWNDLPETYSDPNQRYFIVEYDTLAATVPEPASLLIWSLLAAGTVWARRNRSAQRLASTL